MRILLLVSAFNGLTQRAWCALRESGHEVGVHLATGSQQIIEAVHAANPDLILCPLLMQRVPAEVWQSWRTIIIHPGPVGDRGPSSLDWAIRDAATAWGVTALQAVEEMDAGPIWASRTFPMPDEPPRKSALYNGPVADAALECIAEVVTKVEDSAFTPIPSERARPGVPEARLRPAMIQADREFDWSDPTGDIVRTIRAADGTPGVHTTVAGLLVAAFDAHLGPVRRGAVPGTVLMTRQGAVLVATVDGSVWLGHLKSSAGIKLSAATVLDRRLHGVPREPATGAAQTPLYGQVRYQRKGPVGWLSFDFYNGAMAASHCRRLLTALQHAAGQDTRVLVLHSGPDVFSNGIHLNGIEESPEPARTAWANIRAINDVCREIITCTRQVVIAGYAGNAGAGGVMLGLGADIVAARDGIMLNPYYDIGLYGSELHTYVLPRRVGTEQARRLLDDKLPVSTARAATLGLVDQVGPRHPGAYLQWLGELAQRASDPRSAREHTSDKAKRLAAEPMPLDAYEARELAQMSRDLYDDRAGFAAARRQFVTKVKPTETPSRLLPNWR